MQHETGRTSFNHYFCILCIDMQIDIHRPEYIHIMLPSQKRTEFGCFVFASHNPYDSWNI
ncbi:unnamed protein product [Phytomonas sp. EM1]|nr:unnamed protein product [Phytomonas sp. EM1]|eukprot:CCW64872.1 unnamed protein product [Phytomonas sp. isolate EM1]